MQDQMEMDALIRTINDGKGAEKTRMVEAIEQRKSHLQSGAICVLAVEDHAQQLIANTLHMMASDRERSVGDGGSDA